jgi:hypothetical protein
VSLPSTRWPLYQYCTISIKPSRYTKLLWIGWKTEQYPFVIRLNARRLFVGTEVILGYLIKTMIRIADDSDEGRRDCTAACDVVEYVLNAGSEA